MANPRKEYHWEYYLRNRKARLSYQKAYDAEHKEEKGARMKVYKATQRYGENRLRTLGMDAVYRATKAEREFQKDNPDHIQEQPQSLEDFIKAMSLAICN